MNAAKLSTAKPLPLAFEPTSSDPKSFVARGDGYAIRVEPGSVELRLAPQQRGLGWRLDGVRADVQTIPTDVLPGHVNYLVGSDPAKWRVNIPTYGRIIFRGVYAGIDEVFYGNDRELEHDYVVAPTAKASRIRLHMIGSEATLEVGGELVVRDGTEQFRLRRPRAYQLDHGGVRHEVLVAYVRHADGSFGFKVGAYDRSRPLTIDPVLSYSTYLGGSSGENSEAIAVDAQGSAYVTGLTFSADFPVTSGAVQSTCKSCSPSVDKPDVFVSKLNSTGTALEYSTYVGGGDYDQPAGIAVDSNGNATVGGYTWSLDFPLLNNNSTWGKLTTIGPQSHGFLVSLNPTGTGFNFSTYIAGSASESVAAVAVDSTGNIFALGSTGSPNFPVTSGTITAPASAYSRDDLFIMKFTPAGALTFSALISPTQQSTSPWANSLSPAAVAVDTSDNIFIAGWGSDGFPTTAGSYQPAFKGNPNSQSYNAFIAKLDSGATQILAATYLGGSAQDEAKAIAVDAGGNAYVTGLANSADFPVTTGAFQTSLVKNTSGTACCGSFVAKFDPSLANLQYSTFLRGTNSGAYADAWSIAVDSSGQAVVTGETQATDFPLVDPIVTEPATGRFGTSFTAFVAKLNAAGSGLVFSSYYGGSSGSHGIGVALDASGSAFITGTTNDTDLPATSGAFQTSVPPAPQYVTPSHVYVAKIEISTPGPSLCLSSTSVGFYQVPVGTTSTSRTLTVTNCGNADLSVTSVVATAGSDFTETDNCVGGPVSAGNSCAVQLTFAPTAEGVRSATLLIASNTGVTTRVALTGYGAEPHLGALSGPITFDSMLIGVASPVRNVFVSNVGTATLTFGSITASGDFAQTNNCPATLFPGQGCAVALTFTPTAAGSRTGTLTVTSDDPNGPATATLTGTGLAAYPAPTITSITPDSAAVGSSGTRLNVYGSNLFPASVIQINGVDHPTTYLSNSYLYTNLTADDVTKMSEPQVTVTTPAPGGGTAAPAVLTVYVSMPITATGFVFDPYSRKLLAAVPSGAANYPNSIVPIDPYSGTVGTAIPIGNDPGKMVISDDDRYLYVALNGDHAVERYDLVNATKDIQVQMPSDPTFGQMRALNMAVVPNDSHSFLVTLLRSGVSPAEGGIALFTDGTMRTLLSPNGPSYVDPDAISFLSDPSTAWGVGTSLMKFSLSASGLSLASSQISSPIGGAIQSDGTYLYSTFGQVYDPIHQTSIGKYANVTAQTLAPDTPLQRTFFFGFDGLGAYDQSSFAKVGAIAIGHNVGSSTLARWSSDGLAIAMLDTFGDHTKDAVALFRSRLARPNAATTLTPTLSSTSPAAKTVGSGNFLMTVTGSNFVAGAVVMWNNTELTTKFVNSTTLTAYVGTGDIGLAGTVKIAVKNPNGVSSGTTDFEVAGVVSLSSTSISLGSQLFGTTSSAQSVTLANSGTVPITITAVTTSNGFSETNNCSALAAGASCTVAVMFQPSGPGSVTGSLTITASDGESLTVALAGNATDFAVAAASGSATSATVKAGQSAVFNLAISPVSAFTGNVALTCSGAPALAQCGVSPTSVAVGSGPGTFTVTFTTTAPVAGLLMPSLPPAPPAGGTAFLVLTTVLAGIGLTLKSRLRPAFAIAVLCVALMPACGGGGSTPAPPVKNQQPGTQAGAYSLTVTATSQGVTRQMTLNVTVQ